MSFLGNLPNKSDAFSEYVSSNRKRDTEKSKYPIAYDVPLADYEKNIIVDPCETIWMRNLREYRLINSKLPDPPRIERFKFGPPRKRGRPRKIPLEPGALAPPVAPYYVLRFVEGPPTKSGRTRRILTNTILPSLMVEAIPPAPEPEPEPVQGPAQEPAPT